MLQRGVEKRLLLLVLLHELSSTILRVPPLISLAKTLVGTANSSSRIGLLELELAWMQKLTFPLRYPKIVPVIVAQVMSCCGYFCWGHFCDWSCSWRKKVQLQVGIRSSMMERSSLHDLTCFWQSTVVTVLAPTVVAM